MIQIYSFLRVNIFQGLFLRRVYHLLFWPAQFWSTWGTSNKRLLLLPKTMTNTKTKTLRYDFQCNGILFFLRHGKLSLVYWWALMAECCLICCLRASLVLKNHEGYTANVQFAWCLDLCVCNPRLDLAIWLQRLHGIETPSKWFASMCFFMSPFFASFPHTVHLKNGCLWMFFPGVFSIIDVTIASRSCKSSESSLATETVPVNVS